ncbi:MAG: hypothetical protein Q9174_005339, partial [Haloplaca sp. 1 TL-2023]
MASRVLAFGVPSALVVGGAITAFSSSSANETEIQKSAVNTPTSQGSPFDFNATFFGQTLSYKKTQVVAKAKEFGNEIKQTGAKIIEG